MGTQRLTNRRYRTRMGDTTLAGDGDRPRPAGACSPAEYVAALRRLKRWSGLGYRELEKRARSVGEALPRSTLTAALVRDSLPREDLVVAFVRTCGGDRDELREWVETRRRIAAGADPADPEPVAIGAPDRIPAAPVTVRRGGRPVRALVAAAATVVVAGAVLVAVIATAGGPGEGHPALRAGAAGPPRASAPPPLA